MRHGYAILLSVAAMLMGVLGGCQRQDMDSGAEFASGTEAQSGQVIVGECLVTFFDGSGGEYYSRQEHRIRLAAEAIEVTAKEPQGLFRWTLSGGSYERSVPDGVTSGWHVSVIDAGVLRALLTAVTASGGFYSSESGEHADMVKVEGRWYKPRSFTSAGSPSVRVTLMQRADDAKIDTIYVEDANSGERIIARIYNSRPVGAGKQVVGTKIDILRSASGGKNERIMQVNYESIEIL